MLRKIILLILTIILILLILICGTKIYTKLTADADPIVTTQEAVEDSSAVKELINDNGNTRITTSQAKTIASTIQKITTTNQTPKYTVTTTSDTLVETTKAEGKKNKADEVILTNAANTGTDSTKIDNTMSASDLAKTISTDTPITLNQYNIQAYPGHLVQIAALSNKTAYISYQSKIKVLGATGYIGPAAAYNFDKKTGGIGIAATFPIN